MESVPVHVGKRYSANPICQKVRHSISREGSSSQCACASPFFSSLLPHLIISLGYRYPASKMGGWWCVGDTIHFQSLFLGMALQPNTFLTFGYLRLIWVNMFSISSAPSCFVFALPFSSYEMWDLNPCCVPVKTTTTTTFMHFFTRCAMQPISSQLIFTCVTWRIWSALFFDLQQSRSLYVRHGCIWSSLQLIWSQSRSSHMWHGRIWSALQLICNRGRALHVLLTRPYLICTAADLEQRQIATRPYLICTAPNLEQKQIVTFVTWPYLVGIVVDLEQRRIVTCVTRPFMVCTVVDMQQRLVCQGHTDSVINQQNNNNNNKYQ